MKLMNGRKPPPLVTNGERAKSVGETPTEATETVALPNYGAESLVWMRLRRRVRWARVAGFFWAVRTQRRA